MNRKIYFICPDNKMATGGVKQLYRQVDILNKNGFNACILHKKKNFRSTWFKNETKIEYNKQLFKELNFLIKYNKVNNFKSRFTKFKIQLSSLFQKSEALDKNGILVFPEIYGPHFGLVKEDMKKVIFNQNCYYTFNYYNLEDTYLTNPYEDKNTLATIVASEDATKYISYAFPKLNVLRLRLGIDATLFHYSGQKKKQIAFMPRKLNEDVTQVVNILKIRNQCKDWNFVPIEGKNEEQVAAILRESQLFLSFNYNEGFGLPPAEAMACGCTVIGYQGRGGMEYFKPEFSYPVLDRDIISFVEKIESFISDFDKNPSVFEEKGKAASSFILQEYSFENEEKDIVQIWKQILHFNEL